MALSPRIVQARSAVLRALKAADGTPMSDRVLRDTLKQMVFGDWTELDLGDVIRELELDGFIEGVVRAFDGQRVWTLTDKGAITATNIR